jgi:hypothetical protein
MNRWIALACVAVLVMAAFVTVVDADWRSDNGKADESHSPAFNGVTPSPSAPPVQSPTPTPVPTPIPGSSRFAGP